MAIEIIAASKCSSTTNLVREKISSGLSSLPAQRELLLCDERGLRLYDSISTSVPEYYLFSAEDEILKNNADEIVHIMHQSKEVTPGEVVVELGAGSPGKTSSILSSLVRLVGDENTCPPVTYYALDLEQRQLEYSLNKIADSDIGNQLAGRVTTKGLWGTFDDGLRFIRENHGESEQHGTTQHSDLDTRALSSALTSTGSVDGNQAPLHILFLGSSVGNFSRSEAASFLRSLPLRPYYGDTLLLGLDHDNNKELVELAYNDPQGDTKRFVFNELKAAGRALGDENMFEETKWSYITKYNDVERQYEAFLISKCDQEVYDIKNQRQMVFVKDELLRIERSLKFSDTDAYTMFAEANLRPIQRWTNDGGQYSLWLLERPPFNFLSLCSPLRSSRDELEVKQYSKSAFGVPSRGEFIETWTAWDFITLKMIPPSMLMQKPIDLRHICLFYLGHIPTFLDIMLSKLLKEPNTEPEYFKYIFERGVDPDVDDGECKHSHSLVPTDDDDWPSLSAILNFRNAVRTRLMKVYDDIDSGKITLTRRVGRFLFMSLEHEGFHAETLLYMLLQRAGTGTIPPTGFAVPPWTSLKASWDRIPPPRSPTITLGPTTVPLGHDDSEVGDDTDTDCENHEFGWDNEHPRRTVEVGKFTISWRPVTNGELHSFYTGEGKDKISFPASWVMEEDRIEVRTLYGPVSMAVAKHWPVLASYDTLSTYATIKGGRLPTEAELRLFYDKFECCYSSGANVGFRNWHPVPATTGSERDQGKGTNGGVWEWTSTVWDYVDGFVNSSIYPGYSMDFFDAKHYVVLNGSYVTTPRLASRRSLRNWYQHNYPFAWVGGRIVYDV